MISLDRYKQLADKVEKLQRDHDRAEGALSQLMGRLKSEFSCDTLDAAEKKLKKLEKEAATKEKEFDLALDEFESDWKETFDER
jgi:predicted  nucleic acid-binding Zn-ribbon protein